MNAAGSIFSAAFGVVWCIMAASIGAFVMIPFGLLFIGFSIYSATYHHHNATSEDRYSLIDIVDAEEESDPLNELYGRQRKPEPASLPRDAAEGGALYCPYCGSLAQDDFEFCPKCGKPLPR